MDISVARAVTSVPAPDEATGVHLGEIMTAAADTTTLVADDYDLTLFVIGASALSARAITNARQLCDRYLNGHYHLSVVDLLDDLAALRTSGVLATPTLVRNAPLPVRRLVGDLSKLDRVLTALDIPLTLPVPRSTTEGRPAPLVG